MNAATIKLILALVLFLTWVALAFAKAYVPLLDTTALITAIQAMLAGLGVYHTMDSPAAPTDSPTKEAP